MIKYIFSINTGRSGSHYLSKILKEFENTTSLHEPEPTLNGQPMIEFLKGNSKKMEEMMVEKTDAVFTAKQEGKCYIETNHTFIKGFGWLIPSFIPQEEIGVVFIKRNKEEVIDSFTRINCTPLTYNGLDWIMNPLMINPVNTVPFTDKIKHRILFYLSNLKGDNRLVNSIKYRVKNRKSTKDFVQKYLDWYVEETYAQGEKFKNKFPKIKVFETTINQLNDVEEYEKMFAFFGLKFQPKPSFYEKISTRTNLKVYNKKK